MPSAAAVIAAFVAAGVIAPAATTAQVRVIRRTEIIAGAQARAGGVLDPATLVKLQRAPEELFVYSASDPRLRSRPNEALSCGSPCTNSTGVLEELHPYYELLMGCTTGALTARTGIDHPLTIANAGPVNVLYDGVLEVLGSEAMVRVYNNGMEYAPPTGGGACAFNAPDTPAEPRASGLEREVQLNPMSGLNLTFRQEVVAFGTSDEDSGIRFTLQMTNASSSTATAQIGMRWLLDLKELDDEGPARAAVVCSPFSMGPEETTEHELAAAEIDDFLRIHSSRSVPEVELFLSTAPITRFADTVDPDRLVYGWYGNMFGAPWNYVAAEGDSASSDSVLLHYFGTPDTSALSLAPGDSIRRSIVMLVDCDQGSMCSAPTGSIGNDLRGVAERPVDARFSWAGAVLSPPDARLLRTTDPLELVETPLGIGDETVIATTATSSATDPVLFAAPVLGMYKALPVDSCGTTVFP